MESFINYLGCVKYQVYSGQSGGYFSVAKFTDIRYEIIPFFAKYPLVGVKRQDYLDFVKVAGLMEEKDHLTVEGIEEIRKIKASMNQSRIENN